MNKTTSQDIKATLWKAAGTFRGTIDAANYKDFVLSMLFLKYLDDTYKEFLRDLEERYKGNQVRIERAKRICHSSWGRRNDLIIFTRTDLIPKSVK